VPRTPSFAYKNTSKGWLVDVPPSLSESGSRERRYFSSRDKAKAEATRLKEEYRQHGEGATSLPPRIADDATNALKILEGCEGVSLSEAARFFRTHYDIRAKAPTLAEAWDRAISMRKNHRPTTQRDYRAWRRALSEELLNKKVTDITPTEIQRWIEKLTKSETRRANGLRYMSTVLRQCIKDGVLLENPVERIQRPRAPEQDDEVTVYSPEQLEALFKGCRDYDKGIDRKCSECVVPFAILAFAGLRPNELERLQWSAIDTELGVIRLGSSITKKGRRRNVRIQPTLQAWLDTVPADQREGRVVPGRWRYRAGRVRREAGIDGLEMVDALRHSFGTHLLAIENDLDALKADMGHEHVRVFFNHYHKAMTKREALPYWQVLPTGVEMPAISPVEEAPLPKESGAA